jgi:hypothetical protein
MTINLKNYDPALMAGAEISISSADMSIDDLTVADDAAIGGDLAVTGNTTHTGTLLQTGAATFSAAVDASAGAVKFKRNVLASSGNTTMTAAMSGSVMLIDGASTDYALPAITAADVGMTFLFVSTIISTGTQTITAQAADLLTGGVAIVDVGAVGSDYFAPDVTDDLVLTMNGTTTGGVAVGSWIQYTAISETRWFVQGVLCGSGTLATPFS